MAIRRNIRTGRMGEELAVKWLRDKGFVILLQNWRCGKFEIDVIAERDGLHHCIEVKTRKSIAYGPPENLISVKKLRNMVWASKKYLGQKNCGEIEIDVLAITIGKRDIEFFFIENVGCGNQR